MSLPSDYEARKIEYRYQRKSMPTLERDKAKGRPIARAPWDKWNIGEIITDAKRRERRLGIWRADS